MFAHHVSYQVGSVVAGKATWLLKLDGSLQGFRNAGVATVAPLDRSFFWLEFLKSFIPITIISIGERERFVII